MAGNLLDLYAEESGRAFRRWSATFGGVAKCRGVLGVGRFALNAGPRVDLALQSTFLTVSDPRAVQHIFLTDGGSRYEQSTVGMTRSRFWGPCILAAAGDEHKRHRRVLQAAFNPSKVQQTLPPLRASAKEVRR